MKYSRKSYLMINIWNISIERALRVIPGGNHGWRFTARINSVNSFVEANFCYVVCRDGEERSAVLQQYFIVQRRANRGKEAWRIFQKLFHKIEDISQLRGQNLMKTVHDGVKTLWIEILKGRGPGKFCSARTTGAKVGHDDALSRELFAQPMFFHVSWNRAC